MLKWILLSLVLLILIALGGMSFLTRTTQISKDKNPELQDCPGTPNCVSSVASDPRFSIEPLPVIDGDRSKSWQRAVDLVRNQGGEIVRQDGHYLHAVFTSTLFRFRDDLELVLEQDHIQIRSASRAGRSDLGKNRARVERLRAAYSG